MAFKHNIVIIEDNETFSLLVTHYLKNNLADANVFVVNSGQRAIDSIQRLRPSLVVLDYYLDNDISAKSVMEVINQMPQPPKVILLSSISDEQERDEVMAMGIDRFVPKSNESFYDLVKNIEELMDEYQKLHKTNGLSMKTWVMIFVAVLFASVLTLFLIMG